MAIVSAEEPYTTTPDGRVWAYCTVTSAGSKRIAYSAASNTAGNWKSVEIDDDGVARTARDQTLTVGEHILKFTLASTTTMGENIFRATGIYNKILVPNTVTTFSTRAFYAMTINCDLKFDKSMITTIGQAAFYQSKCYFGDLDFPNLTSLGQSAFYQYTVNNKAKVRNLGSITSLPQEVFRAAQLDYYRFPSTLTSVGVRALYFNSTYAPKAVFYFYSTTPPTLDSTSFYTSPAHIYVPEGSVSTYKAETNWSTYSSKISAIQE